MGNKAFVPLNFYSNFSRLFYEDPNFKQYYPAFYKTNIFGHRIFDGFDIMSCVIVTGELQPRIWYTCFNTDNNQVVNIEKLGVLIDKAVWKFDLENSLLYTKQIAIYWEKEPNSTEHAYSFGYNFSYRNIITDIQSGKFKLREKFDPTYLFSRPIEFDEKDEQILAKPQIYEKNKMKFFSNYFTCINWQRSDVTELSISFDINSTFIEHESYTFSENDLHMIELCIGKKNCFPLVTDPKLFIDFSISFKHKEEEHKKEERGGGITELSSV